MTKIELAMGEVEGILDLARDEGIIESFERVQDENAFGVEVILGLGPNTSDVFLKVELP